jgi:hypothetical protein
MTRDVTGDNRVDVFGFGFYPRADFATAWLNSRGGSIISDDGTRTTFNSEEGMRTLTTLQDTAKSGCFLRSGEDAIHDFARGKVAMIFAQTTQLPEMECIAGPLWQARSLADHQRPGLGDVEEYAGQAAGGLAVHSLVCRNSANGALVTVDGFAAAA